MTNGARVESESVTTTQGTRIAPELAAALARAQASFGTVRKGRSATVTMKSGGSYRYAFADLSSVLEAVRPALAENELALVQLPTVQVIDGAAFVGVETLLVHATGHSISTHMTLPASDSTAQAVGSALTYVRRYSILALLGIAAEDDDTDGARGAAESPRSSRPARNAAPSGSEPAKASENQLRLIWAKARERARENLAEGDEEGEKLLAEQIVRGALPTGVESTRELSVRQVDGMLERIAEWVPSHE